MERLEGSHACVDCSRLDMDISIPASVEGGRSWVERIVTLIVEGDCFEAILCFFDIRARSDFIISEKDGACCFSLGI